MSEYVVKLQEPKHIENLRSHPSITKVGKPKSLYNIVIIRTEMTAEQVASIPGVIGVEDGEERVDKEGSVDDPSPVGWALPWISNSGGSYQHTKSGEGVDIYVVDDGVREDHVDVAGRVTHLWSHDGNGWLNDPNASSPWHGMSVASCAAGSLYGIARDAQIVSLRIQWWVSAIIKALDEALRHHLDKPDDRQSVVVFSGTGPSSLGDAFETLTNYGMTVVAASGNYSEDRPRYPARSGWVVAVGAIGENEEPARFTNLRSNVYAPGVSVPAAGIISPTSVHYVSGTSFSAPLWAGMLACALEGSDKFNTSSHVSTFMFQAQNNMTERDRITPFFNNGLVVRTIAAKDLGAHPFYKNPSFEYTDEDIREFIFAHLHDPQFIADSAREGNVSLKRIARAVNETEQDVDQWFASHGVQPWWYVS